MKALRVLISSVPLLAHAQETGSVHFDIKHLNQPISPQEILVFLAFIAIVGAGVFLLIRRRPGGDATISLTSRHRD